jgi:serine/threonine protein kinase/Tol biopolymer transport system component
LDKGYLLFGRYRIDTILGRGGMGSVFKAIDENLGIPVAVKENLFTTEEYARQFKREATILAGLRHNNLPRVTDHFVIAGQGQYLVMDFIEGEDLRSRIEKGNLPSERLALDWARQICDALHYLHRRQPPVVHRDIKPGNIRITPDGRAMLVDFGLARLMEGASTTTGAKAMTPGFSPPEQYGASRTDSRTDIYALAATLYTLFTGVMPEDGLERALGQKTLTPIRTRNPKISPGVAAAIEKALEVLPENRYQTIGEFFTDLDSSTQPLVEPAAATGGATRKAADKSVSPATPRKTGALPPLNPPISPRKTGALPPLNPPAKPAASPSTGQPPAKPQSGFRFPSGCLIPIFLVLIVIAIGVFLLIAKWDDISALLKPPAVTTATSVAQIKTQTQGPEQPTDTPPQATIQPTENIPTAAPTDTATPATTPLGGSHMFAYVSDKTGLPQVYLRDLFVNNSVQLTNLPEGACQPDWSPDGTELVFVSPCKKIDGPFVNTTIYKIRADGSGITLLTSMPGGDYDPAWSPDGKTILLTSLQDGNQHIYLMDTNGGNRILLSPPGAKESQARWSPSGDRIVFVSYAFAPARVLIMGVSGENRVEYSTVTYPTISPDWSVDSLVLYVLQSRGQVYVSRLDSRFTTIELSPPYMGTTIARFSPDGQQILFDCVTDCSQQPKIVESTTQRDIYLLPIVGSKIPVHITSESGNESDPAWRPVKR